MKWIYVAYHVQHKLPIAGSNHWDTLEGMIDEWMGSTTKEWKGHNPKYPDDYQGKYVYTLPSVKDPNVHDIEEVQVYIMDFNMHEDTLS